MPDPVTARQAADTVRAAFIAYSDEAELALLDDAAAALDVLVAAAERADELERSSSLAAYEGMERRAEAADARADSLQKQVSELVRTARSEQVRADAAEARADTLESALKEALMFLNDAIEGTGCDEDELLADDNDNVWVRVLSSRAALAAAGGAADSKDRT